MEGVWRHLPVYAYDRYYGAYTRYLPENIARFGYYFLQGYMIYCLLDPVDSRYHAGGQVFYPSYHHRNQIEQPETSHEIPTHQEEEQREEENDDRDHDDDNADGDYRDEVDGDDDDDFGHLDEQIDGEDGDEQYALWDDISVDEEEILMWEVDQDDDFNVDLSEEKIDRCLRLRFPERDEEEICVVCQDCLLQEEEKIATLDCGHEYHGGCIKNWLMHKNCCPLCKATAISNKVF